MHGALVTQRTKAYMIYIYTYYEMCPITQGNVQPSSNKGASVLRAGLQDQILDVSFLKEILVQAKQQVHLKINTERDRERINIVIIDNKKIHAKKNPIQSH